MRDTLILRNAIYMKNKSILKLLKQYILFKWNEVNVSPKMNEILESQIFLFEFSKIWSVRIEFH